MMKPLAFTTFLFTLTTTAVWAQGDDNLPRQLRKNFCDQMVASKTSTDEQVQRCIERYGKSEYYLEQEKIKQAQVARDAEKAKDQQAKEAAKTEVAEKLKNNFEEKTFGEVELAEAAFGKYFVAFENDYKHLMRWREQLDGDGKPIPGAPLVQRPDEERVTEGDALCSFLGYEKAIKSIISPELSEADTKNGLYIDSGWLSGHDKEPSVYNKDTGRYRAKKYVSITCKKIKDKSIDGSKDELKKAVEMVARQQAFDKPQPKNTEVNDGARKPANGKTTPHGYQGRGSDDPYSTLGK